jgi:hypothetical protein
MVRLACREEGKEKRHGDWRDHAYIHDLATANCGSGHRKKRLFNIIGMG